MGTRKMVGYQDDGESATFAFKSKVFCSGRQEEGSRVPGMERAEEVSNSPWILSVREGWREKGDQ